MNISGIRWVGYTTPVIPVAIGLEFGNALRMGQSLIAVTSIVIVLRIYRRYF